MTAPVRLKTCNRPIEASGQACLRVSGHSDHCEPDPEISRQLDGEQLLPDAQTVAPIEQALAHANLETEAALEAFAVMLELSIEANEEESAPNLNVAYEEAARRALDAGQVFDRVVAQRQDELDQNLDPKLRSLVRNEIRTLEDAAEVLRLDPKKSEDVRGVLRDCASALRLAVGDQESRSST